MKKMSKTAKFSGNQPSVVFFGSGPVAAKSLELLAQNFDIEAVVTKPKPDHHKHAFPVIDSAKKLNLPIYTVSNKTDLSELIAKKPFNSNLGVLIDFGIIVARDVIDYFPLGIINSHFSVLPEWRGADPITFSILSGQKSTGVSLMLLVEKMDEGPLLSFGEFELPEKITTPQLTEHLINFSNQMLINEIPRYIAGAKPSPQSITGRKVSYSRKLTKLDGVIDWNKSAEAIEREIRAFIDWPKSRTTIAGKDIIVTDAYSVATVSHGARPGDIEAVPESGLIMVVTGNGSLCINKLKPAGKNEMTSKEFLAGHKNLL
jgi:methionyl-tRNA formyltransferase